MTYAAAGVQRMQSSRYVAPAVWRVGHVAERLTGLYVAEAAARGRPHDVCVQDNPDADAAQLGLSPLDADP